MVPPLPAGIKQLFCNGVVDAPVLLQPPHSQQVPAQGLCVSRCLRLEGVGCLECWGFSKPDLATAATTGHFIE